MDSKGITGAQAVLEEVMEAALEGLQDAQVNGDHGAVIAYHHILSMAVANADALGVEFVNTELSGLNPDKLLMGESERAKLRAA